ncbi:MAG: hypothetical protein AAGD38_17180, partial [Acidobacteriota bacterium]
MPNRRVFASLIFPCIVATAPLLATPTITVELAESLGSEPIDGRLIVIFATETDSEPRFQVGAGVDAPQIFGVDVEGAKGGDSITIDASVFGYPIDSLHDVPAGTYYAQALLHRYETFHRADGHVVKLPMDRGEGQQWRRAPGNHYSEPREVTFRPTETLDLLVDQTIPPIEPPADTEYIKHIQIESKLLSEFWGRPMHLGAHVLLPHGFDEHPDARYPLMVFHGHFPSNFGGFRTEPPDPDLEPDFSERFGVEGYNRIQQQEAYDFYQRWISRDFPRFIIIEIQHPTPYYDDSYAVNSENNGPYGDALTYELIPEIERRFRGIGEGWSRFLYGGSTGGWEAMAVQVLYPDDYNGAFVACPDPIDFRAFLLVDIYKDTHMYDRTGPFRTVEIPAHRNDLGDIDITMRDYNHMELVLGTKNRSGDQFDIWEAVYSPVGDDGYPKKLWNKMTGEIDHEVAEHWRENYDLVHIMKRDWAKLGPKLAGKLHIYCGDMDNYYLNNAVYLAEEFLEGT